MSYRHCDMCGDEDYIVFSLSAWEKNKQMLVEHRICKKPECKLKSEKYFFGISDKIEIRKLGESNKTSETPEIDRSHPLFLWNEINNLYKRMREDWGKYNQFNNSNKKE